MSSFLRNRKAPTAAVGLTALALLSAGCASAETDDPSVDMSFQPETCESGVTSADALKVGTLLPMTGSLAYLGPSQIAGVGLAVADINAAGGVLGRDACTFFTDSGDSTDMTVSNNSSADLVDAQVSFFVGATASSVTMNVIDYVTEAPLVQISPANTSIALSGYSPFYFRTAPPDTVQGSALGQLIVSDGHQNTAVVVANDPAMAGLRDQIQLSIEEGGGAVSYGATGTSQEFPPGQTTFSSEVTAALASSPDAVVVIAFDETRPILSELIAQGWDASNIYFIDGNTVSYEEDFESGTLTGAQGTIPGASPTEEFQERLNAWHLDVEGSGLSTFPYAPESYDAVILGALAAVRGEATDPETIQANMAAVSGASGGEACSTFAECTALLDEGSEIAYQGVSGLGPFNTDNDPSSAFIGVYRFDESNVPEWVTSIEGRI